MDKLSRLGGGTMRVASLRSKWVVEGMFERGCVTLVQGDPGSKKTWLGLELVRAVGVSGKFLGKWVAPHGHALMLTMDSGEADVARCWQKLLWEEDDDEHTLAEMNESVSFVPVRGVPGQDAKWMGEFASWLNELEHSFRGTGYALASEFVMAEGEFDQEGYDAAAAQLSLTGVDLVVVDSLISAHQVDENDNVAMAQVMENWRMVARETGAAIVILHHTGKPMLGGKASLLHRGRGASSIASRCDAIWDMQAMADASRSKMTHVRNRGETMPEMYISLAVGEESAQLNVALGHENQEEVLALVAGGELARAKVVEWMRTKVPEYVKEESKARWADNHADMNLKSLVRQGKLEVSGRGMYRLKVGKGIDNE